MSRRPMCNRAWIGMWDRTSLEKTTNFAGDRIPFAPHVADGYRRAISLDCQLGLAHSLGAMWAPGRR